MEYLTVAEASEAWNIDISRIGKLLREGRLAGVRAGKHWLIPKSTPKPADGRTRNGKIARKKEAANETANETAFRFPCFEGRELSSFLPPLSPEELILKKTGEAFHACRFETAESLIRELLQKTENRYIRILALYESCMICMMLGKNRTFFEYYEKLASEFLEDFPYKKELSLLPHEIDACLGSIGYFVSEFKVYSACSWHESFLPHLANLSIVSLYYANKPGEVPKDLNSCELFCILFENSKCYTDLQAMHLYLGIVYVFAGDTEKMKGHFRKGLELAEEHELYWLPALLQYYYGRSFSPVLAEFSKEFREKLLSLSKDVHIRYSRFMEKASMSNIFVLLGNRDYIFLFFAANGYLNKQIAQMLHISEKSVGKRFSEIYEKAGVRNKRELAEYYLRSIRSLSNIKPPDR